jgi:hypothetical protein
MEVFMKNTITKAVLFLVLTVFCFLPVFAGGGQQSEVPMVQGTVKYPAYLNTGDTYSIVKKGNNVTLRVLTATHPQFGGKTEDLYFWKWVDHKMNIKVRWNRSLQPPCRREKLSSSPPVICRI